MTSSTLTSTSLLALLKQPGLLVAPGASDAFTARLIQQAGFSAVYVTGAGVANTLLGTPDLGLVTMTEMVEQVRRICEAVTIPVIADADTGYGNPLNVMRTVRAFEAAGAAAIHLEDQVSPKRCGHFAGKEVIPADEMAQKLKAALDARRDANFVIIARTDSLATHGFDEAVTRGQLYAELGADMMFVDAPTTREQIEQLPKRIHAPLLFNMVEGAKTPLCSHAELERFGYKVVIHPSLALRIAAQAVADALQTLRVERSSATLMDKMMGWNERQRVVGLPEYERLERKYAA